MAKRGRKPKENKKEYFGKEEEEAVLRYLSADTREEKNKIFEEYLKYPFEKMIESIIRRYKLYVPDEESGDTFNDTTSFLMTKMDKFKPGQHKAYSYYGAICKNYLIGKIQNFAKTLERNPLYETVSGEIANDLKYSCDQDRGSRIASESMELLIKRIGHMLENPKKYSLKENEIKVGGALKNLLENWDYVLTTDGSNKLNKNAILFFLRESTGLDTKGVRDNMRKFKNEFIAIKNIVIR